MGFASMWVRAELRTRWREQLALVLIVGIIGAVGLTCIAGARRTMSAPDRFVRSQAIPDVEMQVDDGSHVDRLGRLPGAATAGTYLPLFAAPNRKDVIPGLSFIVFAPGDLHYTRTLDRPLVVSGRMPDPRRANEVVASAATAAHLHMHLGDRVPLRSIGSDQLEKLASGSTDVKLNGPRPTVTVVGVVRTRIDVVGVGYASDYFVTSKAFADRYSGDIAYWGRVLDVRLEPGTTPKAYGAAARKAAGAGSGFTYSSNQDGLQGVDDATRVQGVALLLVGIAGMLGGTVAILQMVGRSVAASTASRRRLAEIGATSREVAAAATLALVPAAVGGAVLALALSWVASGRFPVGVAGDIEVNRGRQLDATVAIVGVLVLVIVVLGRALLAARRPARDRVAPTLPLSDLASAAGGVSPSAGVGVRWATRGTAGVAARTALVGVVIAVIGLCGAATYRAGAQHLITHPRSWGATFDIDAGGGDDPSQLTQMRKALLGDRAVGDVTRLDIVGTVTFSGHDIPGYTFTRLRGDIRMALMSGHEPGADDEVVLGTKTARTLGVGPGDDVTATTEHGHRRLRVVGLGLFPTTETDKFTTGAALTLPGLRSIARSEGYQELVFRWRPGVDRVRAQKRLVQAQLISGKPTQPPEVSNLVHVRRYPLLLAGFFGFLAVVALGHTVAASTSRRRHEIGVLRAIGFVRRQVVTSAVIQAGVLAVAGLVIGAPLGIALGRWIWHLHARHIGVGDAQVLPAIVLLASCLVVMALVVTVGAASGSRAVRRSASVALRAE